MAIKQFDAGGLAFLNILFGATAKQTSFTLQLITDANALADADTNSTHTVATGGGYADKALSNNATVALDGSSIPKATWSAQTFTFTGPLTGNATIKGYQVLNGTTMLWGELITNFTPANNGDTLTITPSFQLGNGTPA